MLEKFKKHINTRFPFLKDKKLLIAISGGIDSVILVHLLSRLEFNLTLAHCNFRLRGNESDRDEQFVIDLAKSLKTKVLTNGFDTIHYAEREKISIQMAARDLRYNWFEELAEEHGLDYILTAHHLDDNLETVLINFTRGTGVDGLSGIPEINKNILRPLLPFSRAEIEKYASANNLNWREDSSNEDTKYDRNKIRHKVIPKLKEINPNLLNSFQKTLKHISQSREILSDRINVIKQEVIEIEEENILKIDIKKIRELSNSKAYLYQILNEYNFTEWNDIVKLLDAQSGKQILSETHRLIKDRDHFLLKRKELTIKTNNYRIKKNQKLLTTADFSIYINETTDQVYSLKNNDTILVNGDLLEFPLTIRKWKKGDYFYPFGMQGKKKVSKFFKDEKFSILDKENTWILSSNDDIVWIVGKRLDNRFKITENTQKIVQMKYVNK